MRTPCILAAVCLLASGSPLAAADCETFEGETFEGEDITLELVAAGLSRPVDIQSAPGDTERLFVVEQRGIIRIIDLATDTVRPGAFLNIQSRVERGGNEQGLLGLAFHPNYFGEEDGPGEGEFFVDYTRRGDGDTVVARYRVSGDDPDVADPQSEEILLTASQPFGNHNAGQIVFGPNDGYLYVSMGDGGSGGDPQNNGQDPNELLGKLLRIDVDGQDSGLEYAIPSDNPFAADGDGVRDEIWALGLRNPWRFDFDPDNGDLYIADVGQNQWEEIDYVPADSPGGENYEWRVREGDHSFNAGTAYGPGTRVGPVFEYPHGGGFLRGCSITGGVVYRGCRMPDLQGTYFFADLCNQWVGSLRVEDGVAGGVRNLTPAFNAGIAPRRVRQVTTFGRDAMGEVYIGDLDNSAVFRIISEASLNQPPTASIVADPQPPEVVLVNGSAEVSLDASGSDDGDGGTQTLTYSWEQTGGPDSAVISDPAADSVIVTFSETGDYAFGVTVDDGEATDAAEVDVSVIGPAFLRSDCNGDGDVDVSDPIFTFRRLFLGGRAPDCDDACDTNDDEVLDIADGVTTLEFLFLGIGDIPLPGLAACGVDPDGDGLQCDEYGSCP